MLRLKITSAADTDSCCGNYNSVFPCIFYKPSSHPGMDHSRGTVHTETAILVSGSTLNVLNRQRVLTPRRRYISRATGLLSLCHKVVSGSFPGVVTSDLPSTKRKYPSGFFASIRSALIVISAREGSPVSFVFRSTSKSM